jgi:hypothetical protein
MPYSVTVNHPDVGEQDVFVNGLGTLPNGSTTEISDEQDLMYQALNATQNQTHTPDGGLQVESVLGSPVIDLDSSPWFTVTVIKPRSNDKETKGGKE